jgi:uncharacterized Zn-binding protein involved in type VI secretion
MGSPVTFVGASDIPHCSPMVRAQGNPLVRINGIPVSCQGANNSPHLIPTGGIPPCVVHVAAILVGSLRVRASGLGVGRVGDIVGPVCTAVGQGSPNVLAG